MVAPGAAGAPQGRRMAAASDNQPMHPPTPQPGPVPQPGHAADPHATARATPAASGTAASGTAAPGIPAPGSGQAGDAPASTPPQLQVRDGVATLTLNRPAQRNRLENEDLALLMAQLAEVEQDASVRVLVLQAETRGQTRPVFCAGYDIGGFREPDQGAGAFERVAERLAALRAVTVCALNGSVYGGATDLVLACDLRLAVPGIEWRMPATALGLHYYPGGLQRYVNHFGLAGAKRAFLSARPFTATQLQAMGLFEAVVPPAELPAAVQALIRDILALAPLALQHTKQSLNEIGAGQARLPDLREREARCAASLDFAEGRNAFAERRTPRFQGR